MPRPIKVGVSRKNSTIIATRVTHEQKKQFREAALDSNSTFGAWIRKALLQYLQEN